MKRLMINVLFVSAALMFAPQQADAQFFKKLKKAAETVLKETVQETTQPATPEAAAKQAAAAAPVTVDAKGVGVVNPCAKEFDLEFVSAVGDKAANTVTVYVKATAKRLNYSGARIGGKNDGKATDADGNEYETNSSTDGKTLTVGVPVKCEFAKFVKVPATVSTLVVVYGGWWLDSSSYSRSGINFVNDAIQLRNVPVTWE